MNLPIEQFIPSGAGLITSLGAVIGMWFKFQNKVERLEEGRDENKRQIDAFWKWKDMHEKEAVELRSKYQEQLSELKGTQLVTTEQFRQIMQMFEEIKTRLADLENMKGRNGI